MSSDQNQTKENGLEARAEVSPSRSKSPGKRWNDKSGFFSNRKSTLYKNTLCTNYMAAGYCPFENRCTFAHGRYELRPVGFKGNFEEKVKEMPQWKTVLCSFYSQDGFCKHGDDCGYAHGDNERRLVVQTWKSEPYVPPVSPCKFYLQNRCRAGDSCFFSHDVPSLTRVDTPTSPSSNDASFFASTSLSHQSPTESRPGESLPDASATSPVSQQDTTTASQDLVQPVYLVVDKDDLYDLFMSQFMQKMQLLSAAAAAAAPIARVPPPPPLGKPNYQSSPKQAPPPRMSRQAMSSLHSPPQPMSNPMSVRNEIFAHFGRSPAGRNSVPATR